MKIANIKDYTNGWFIGDFEPSILKTKRFEVAHHSYKKGYIGQPHYHAVATEYNYIVSGKLTVVDNFQKIELKAGDIFIFEPNQVSRVEFLEDTELIIIKTPSASDDKYLV